MFGKAAAGAFHLLDDAVEALGSGVGDAELKEHQDVRPPRLDRGREPRRLRHLGGGAGAVEGPEPGADVGGVAGGEQLAQQFLDAPGGADLIGRVVSGEDPFEAAQLTG